jgi:hypothetical protein
MRMTTGTGSPVIVKIHAVASDGLPDMDRLVGRVAFIFDGCVVSGWPLDEATCPRAYERARTGEGLGGAGRTPEDIAEGVKQLWEADSDVGHGIPFAHVTHWIEFPVPVWDLAKPPAGK